jgi:ribosome biogenesis GTPase A
VHRYQDVKVTPYEKNLEVWRQLWRVVERADVLIQVVDARQPLFYYSQHLHDYARTHYRHPSRPAAKSVERLMIINKADYLVPSQRRAWGKVVARCRLSLPRGRHSALARPSARRGSGSCGSPRSSSRRL